MHRFIPLHAKWAGARVAEVEVSHNPRRQGKSKYGLGRTFKVLLDLITVKFLGDYSTKPLYFFGGLGFVLCLLGIGCGVTTLVQKYTAGAWVHRNPLLLLAVFLFIVGLLLVFLGLLGELLVRIYHETQSKPIYLLADQPPGLGKGPPRRPREADPTAEPHQGACPEPPPGATPLTEGSGAPGDPPG